LLALVVQHGAHNHLESDELEHVYAMPRDNPSLLREDVLTPLLVAARLDLVERHSTALDVFLVQQDDRVAVLKSRLNLLLTVA
jgi:hypothetical protein